MLEFTLKKFEFVSNHLKSPVTSKMVTGEASSKTKAQDNIFLNNVKRPLAKMAS